MKELFHRTSVRKYLDKQVEDEKVEMMLKGAMAAPSAGNQQPWEFYVVKNKETIEKLSKNKPLCIMLCICTSLLLLHVIVLTVECLNMSILI